LWPSAEASRTWGRPWNAVEIGPKRDLMGELADATRAAGLKFGFYYSLYEWFNPLWLKDRARYVDEHMTPQFKDVVTRYKPAIIFSDGEWDLPSKDWKSESLLAWLFNESPARAEVVVNDRWGKDCRHKHGGYWTTEYAAGLKDGAHPWEESRGMAHSYGLNRAERVDDYKTAREFILVLIDLVSRGGNLLLDIGPAADGTIPPLMEQRLLEIGDWLKVNGEAIYGTRFAGRSCQWTEGTPPKQEYGEYMVKYNLLDQVGQAPKNGVAVKQVFFTKKPDALYAITAGWPGRQLVLRGVKVPAGARVTMLGVPGDLRTQAAGDTLTITMPDLGPEAAPCRHAFTLKIAGGEVRPE
jgi:alpha-L-fucosidase